MACCLSSLLNCPTNANQGYISNRCIRFSLLIAAGAYAVHLIAQHFHVGNAAQTIGNSARVLTNLTAELIAAANSRNLAAGGMIFAAFVIGSLAITFLCNWISCCDTHNKPVTQPMTPAQIEAKRAELKAAVTTAPNSKSSEAATAALKLFETDYPEIIL